MVALGRARQAKGRQHYDGDVNMPAFLTAKNLKPFIHSDLAVTSSQVEFKTVGGTKAFGYAAELLPKVCEVFLKAESAGALLPMQKHIGEQCRILLIGLASTGVVALVDEATGYQDERPRDALQAYLEKIISKELAAWVKKFPDEFYHPPQSHKHYQSNRGRQIRNCRDANHNAYDIQKRDEQLHCCTAISAARAPRMSFGVAFTSRSADVSRIARTR